MSTQLNPAQQEAVCAPPGHLLVLAGAGSGKTAVLVHRIAWLIQSEHLHPHHILAVTFTNKAANEMRHRIEKLLHLPTQSMWVGTFHGLAHRLLRLHWQEAGLSQNFQILDADDQIRLVRRTLKTLQLDEERWPPRQAANFINSKKEQGLRPNKIQAFDPYTQTSLRIYDVYETLCQQNGLVDFTEILLRSLELLLKNATLLEHYQTRFRHILVDEFQDTNTIQYTWIRLLAGQKNALTMVGDDDQSIYGWRGAKIENIQRFNQDFSDSRILRLEQNYRSTSTILEAANALIANNGQRLGKNLWTAGEKGEPISLYAAFNEIDEAKFIVEQIKKEKNDKRNEIAVLYRSNAQSRILEDAFIQSGIPYRIYGGLRFFERAEIKDALAYLRLLLNNDDNTAFERIINVPTRGIGEQTLSTLRDHAKTTSSSLWQAMLFLLDQKCLPTRASQALNHFYSLIEELRLCLSTLTLQDLTSHVIHQTGLLAHYEKEKGEKAQARKDNLAELITATRQFTSSPEKPSTESITNTIEILAEFLSTAALEGGEYQSQDIENCVQLMTLHAAKGLEFPFVFICGVEEGLFPHPMNLNDEQRLEEERRLCYVGMTRAMKKLFLTYAEIRRVYGQEHYHRASRFIREIPSELLDEVRLSKFTPPPKFDKVPSFKNPITASPSITTYKKQEHIPHAGLSIGQHIMHPKFGEGTIVNYEGQGEQTRIQIQFKKAGIKWLMQAYAKLEKI